MSNDKTPNDNQQASQPGDSSQVDEPQHYGNTTHDLRKHAEEALRLLREAQAKAAEQANPETPEKDDSETMVTSRDAFKNQPEHERSVDKVGNTTYDLAREAREAMEAMRREQAEKRTQESGAVDADAFEENMVLRIDIAESLSPLIVDVTRDMVVGRGDNVTEFIPDIDLTKQGAYRLGLSRRHAILRRDAGKLVVLDQGSRNGTHLNGLRLDSDKPYALKSGDEVQFGNLKVRVTFQRK